VKKKFAEVQLQQNDGRTNGDGGDEDGTSIHAFFLKEPRGTEVSKPKGEKWGEKSSGRMLSSHEVKSMEKSLEVELKRELASRKNKKAVAN